MNLVDTSGWVEYFFGGPSAGYFAEPIEATDALIVPVICLYEIFKKVLSVADEASAFGAVAQMKQGHVIGITEDIALSAARISLRHKLPMADSLILAFARAHHAALWTQDSRFEGLVGVHYRGAQGKTPR